MIVEEEKLEAPDQDDIASFVKVLEADFYFSVRFFIGRYYGAGERLRHHYRREQQYFQNGRRHLPQISEHDDRGNGISGNAHGRKQGKAFRIASGRGGVAVSERTGAEAYDSGFY